MNISSMQQLFTHELARTLDAEDTIAQGLQQMAAEVENPDLKAALSAHETQTRQQIENLTQIFRILNQDAQAVECASAEALAREYKESTREISSPEIKDLATVMAAQKVEHLEIATYRSLMRAAEEIGNPSIMSLLRENLHQEEQMAQKVEQFSRQLTPAHH